MRRAVILEHCLPNGDHHFDLMIDQPEVDSEHRLLSFQCRDRPDLMDSSWFFAKRLPAHRAIYLEYEGAISGNRGFVQQVASGLVEDFCSTSQSLKMTIRWANSVVVYRGQPGGGQSGEWKFECQEPGCTLDGDSKLW